MRNFTDSAFGQVPVQRQKSRDAVISSSNRLADEEILLQAHRKHLKS